MYNKIKSFFVSNLYLKNKKKYKKPNKKLFLGNDFL